MVFSVSLLPLPQLSDGQAKCKKQCPFHISVRLLYIMQTKLDTAARRVVVVVVVELGKAMEQ